MSSVLVVVVNVFSESLHDLESPTDICAPTSQPAQFGFARHLTEHDRGFGSAVIGAGQYCGPAVGTFGAGLLMARYGWRPVFVGIGLERAVTDPNAQQQDIFAQMHMALADNLARSDQPSESMHEYQSALQIYEAMHSDPGNTGTNVEIATCKVGIATAERLTGEQQAAAADFQQALTLTAPSVARKDRDALHDAAKAYAGLGDIEATQAVESDFAERENHWKKAIQSYRHSLEIGKQIPLLAQYDPVGFRAVDVARSLQRAESELDKFVEASR